MNDEALRRLAVYGSLGPGKPNHHQLAGLNGDLEAQIYALA